MEMMKKVDRCYRRIFWSEEVGGLWKMIQRKRNLDVRYIIIIIIYLLRPWAAHKTYKDKKLKTTGTHTNRKR